jgi:hypothetical protein
MTATNQDAVLMVQLMRWGSEMGLNESLSAIFAEGFDPATAAMDDASVRTVLTFGETVGALVKHHVLDKGLLSDIFWIDGIWSRVRAHAYAAREMEGEPSLYENFEALAVGVRTA